MPKPVGMDGGEFLYVIDANLDEIAQQPIADPKLNGIFHNYYKEVHDHQKMEGGRKVVDTSVVVNLTPTLADSIKEHCHAAGLQAIRRIDGDYQEGTPMSDIQARHYYNGVIGGFRECQVGLTALNSLGMVQTEDYARLANAVRHEARLYTREHMADQNARRALEARDLHVYGNKDGPTFDSLYQRHIGSGKTPEQAYNAIIESATRTNRIVNAYIAVTTALIGFATAFASAMEEYAHNVYNPYF